MSTIILLNGCGSAGKSSLAKSLQEISEIPWLTFGVDTFFDMLPEKFISFDASVCSEYLTFKAGVNERGPNTTAEIGKKGEIIFGLMPKLAAMLANIGENLIIDEVLFGDTILQSYTKELKGNTFYFIGVMCDLPTMQAREKSRGDRIIGLSNDQIDKVHEGYRDYDLIVDTAQESSVKLAEKILDYIESNPHPKLS